MAFETRGSGQYYYRSRRVNGHAKKIYIGSGIRAQQAYEIDQQHQARREQEQAVWKQIEALNVQTDTLSHTTRTLVKAHLLLAGFRQHNRSEWRKRRTHNITQEGDSMTITTLMAETETIETLEDLLKRGMQGEQEVLPAIQTLLNQIPAIWEETFSLVKRVETAWIQTIAGQDLITKESLERQVAALKSTLEAESTSPLEHLIIETICTTWLAWKQADLSMAERLRSGLTLSVQQENHLTASQKRYLSAIKELARIRQLLTQRSNTTVLNIAQQQQVNVS